MATGGVVRGCGTRVEGGIYIEVGLSGDGEPVEAFLMDPPRRMDEVALGLSSIGNKLVYDAKRDVYHVLDIVGQEHYPNVADFIEEVRRFGVSRRTGALTEFEKLTPGSKLILLHRRAVIENPEAYNWARAQEISGLGADFPGARSKGGRLIDLTALRMAGGFWCPQDRPDHVSVHERLGEHPVMAPHCASLYWEDVDGMGETAGRVGERQMPSFSYPAQAKPVVAMVGDEPVTVDPVYSLGAFASFPISNIAVIRAKDGSHEEALEKARASKLPVDLLEE